MIERFLQYSLRHNRPVRALVQEDTMKYETLTVIALDEQNVSYITSRRKTPKTLPLNQILAVSYARGDDGDTLKNQEKERAND